MFNFACRHCSRTNEAEWGWVGKTIDCTGCGRTVLVPAPMETVDRGDATPVSASSVDRLKFRCQQCGRRYASRPELIGKKIRCGGCGATVRVPDPGSVCSSGALPIVKAEPRALERSESPRSRRKKSAPRSSSERTSPRPVAPNFLDDDLPIKTSSTHQAKPAEQDDPLILQEPAKLPRLKSRKPKTEGGELIDRVLPSRSEKMAEIEAEEAAKAEAKLEKKRKRKKQFAQNLANKHIGGGMIMQDVVNILGASVVGVVVISLICWGFPESRFMIGGGLTVLGFLVYLLGTAGFAKVAREEGAMYAAMCRFVPLYKWYYLITRWDEMKGHFVFFCVGLIFLWPGLFILKISPQGQRADAEEKAYNQKFEGQAPLAPLPPQVPPASGQGEPDVD